MLPTVPELERAIGELGIDGTAWSSSPPRSATDWGQQPRVYWTLSAGVAKSRSSMVAVPHGPSILPIRSKPVHNAVAKDFSAVIDRSLIADPDEVNT